MVVHMKNFDGVHALVPTPLTKKIEIDTNSLRKLIDFELENGCIGIGVLAAIGEARARLRFLRTCARTLKFNPIHTARAA